MEIIPPELMNDEKPQIDRNHSKRRAIRNITLLDINYVTIQEYQYWIKYQFKISNININYVKIQEYQNLPYQR